MKEKDPDAGSEPENKFFLGFCKCIRILFLIEFIRLRKDERMERES